MHDFLQKPKRRHVKEIPLAPILDLLTVVIFFLILSTSFIELRQNLLPPSSTISTEVPLEKQENIPLNPKIIVLNNVNEIEIILKWTGQNPGEIKKNISVQNKNYENQLKIEVNKIVKDFVKQYPNEKSIQLGWAANTQYQLVLNVVDGVITELKDIVFISPEDAMKSIEKVKNEV